MTLHIATETDPGTFVDVDLQALGLIGTKLTVDYSHATRFDFNILAPEHTEPIATNTFIRVWDEGQKLADGVTDQDVDHPMFEGYIEKPQPSGPGRLDYTAFDPTYRSNTHIQVHDLPWTNDDPPVHDPASICRAVYNCFNLNDPDFSASITTNATVGGILSSILDYQKTILQYMHAAPADPDLSYIIEGELDGMTTVPQERIVLQGGVRACLEQVIQQYERRARIVFTPGTRIWRFIDLTQAPQVTLTLNDPSEDFPVLQCSLRPSIDHCATARRVDGPYRAHVEEFVWYATPGGRTNTLQTYGDSTIVGTYTDGDGTHDIVGYSAWQVIDEAKRRGLRTLPEEYAAFVAGSPSFPGQPPYLWQTFFEQPVLMISYDDGDTYMAVDAAVDILNGIMRLPADLVPQVTVKNSSGGSLIAGSTQTIFTPNAVKVVWAPRDAALSVRIPAEGYEGSAFDDFGIARELAVFDESLAVGIEYGAAVTTATREAAFQTLLQAELNAVKDVVWAGQIVLDGIDYRWLGLGARINIAAADGDGGTIANFPWAAINAFATSVEFDFPERMTTITLNSDHLEAMADTEQLKSLLKIKALQQRQYSTFENTYRDYVTYFGNTVKDLASVRETVHFEYVDEQTGAVQ